MPCGESQVRLQSVFAVFVCVCEGLLRQGVILIRRPLPHLNSTAVIGFQFLGAVFVTYTRIILRCSYATTVN